MSGGYNEHMKQHFLAVLKHIALVVLMVVCLGVPPVFAADSANDLTRMEQQLFSRSYPGETQEARLSRVENAVFGESRQGQSPDVRFKALGQFFQFPQGPPQAMANQPQPIQRPPIQEYSKPPALVSQAPNESQYPTVSAMEQRVFRQTFENNTIDARLERLESRVIGRPQQGTLQERTDQLRMMVLGDTGNGFESSMPLAQGSMGDPGSGYGGPGPVNPDLIQGLAPVEKKVLRQTYPQDSPEVRLNRLEMKLFNATAPELPPEDRFYRIVGVANAKSNSRYDQAYQIGPGGRGSFPPSGGGTGGAMGTFGSMLLMILMSLI